MTIMLLIISLSFISAEIYACKRKARLLKNIAKPFLVPSMTLVLASLMHSQGMDLSSIYLFIAAMALYALGDVLLIPEKGSGLFIAGMVSFALGHVVISLNAASTGISLPALVISALAWFTVLVFGFFPRLDPQNHMTVWLKAYSVIVTLYGIVVSSSSFHGNLMAHILSTIGVCLFAISDSMIALRITDGRERETRVMVTYVLAVAFLIAGMYAMGR